MLTLNWCCCCVPLRAGALTIGSLYLLVNIGVLLGWTGCFFAELVRYNSVTEDKYGPHFRTYRFTGVVLGGLAVLCGVNITIDSLLVHGIRRNRRKFMLPWVVWYGIFTSLVTLALLGFFIWLLFECIEESKHATDSNPLVGVMIAVGCVAGLSLPVMWYWYACVVSYYAVLAPSDVYVMESLQEQDTTGAPPSYRPVEKDII